MVLRLHWRCGMDRALIAVMLVWLLVEAVMQGSFVVILKPTESTAGSNNVVTEVAVTNGIPWNERFRQISETLMPKLHGSSVEKKSWTSLRSPRIALIFPHLEVSPDSLFLVTLMKVLRVLGYDFELYAMKEGFLRTVWEEMGVPVNIVKLDSHGPSIDWSTFEGVVAMSFYAKFIFYSLTQEPFKKIPVLWIIHDVKPIQRSHTTSTTSLRRAFERSNTVVFPSEDLLNVCGRFNTGNFRVISGSPREVWEAEHYMSNHQRNLVRQHYALNTRDFALVIATSNSNLMWKSHALFLHSLAKLTSSMEDESYPQLKLFVLGPADSTGKYEIALKAMAFQFAFLNSSVHYVESKDHNGVLWAADVVAYVAVDEEKYFPPVLIRSMAFERIVLAPDSKQIQEHVFDGVNGMLYPEGDYDVLCHRIVSLWQTTSKSFHLMTSASRVAARNLLAMEAVIGYGEAIEKMVDFPSEVLIPRSVANIPDLQWQWNLLANGSDNGTDVLTGLRDPVLCDADVSLDELSSSADVGHSRVADVAEEDYDGLEEAEIEKQKTLQLLSEIDRLEEQEVQIEERAEQMQATFEDVNRGVKRAEREKNEFHERDDGELERTGQPLCIYEPYIGSGAWPFLHQNYPLYRGLSLSSRGRRAKYDDVDGPARLPLLNDTYYRNAICEFGAFLAIANRLDRVHKNFWIGFQPWMASGRKVALTEVAEYSLLEALRKGLYGDAVYFWADLADVSGRTGATKEGNFWSLCDARNAGSCRRVFVEAYNSMYGLSDNSAGLPYMPYGGVWAGLNCWAMPTSSFMEFILFSRIFLDAMDSQWYAEHHEHGHCPLASSSAEGEQCYCRVLEVLVNVWAYHSGRRMVYVNPKSGEMREYWEVEYRRGEMKVKWLSMDVLKGMDEDMAERADDNVDVDVDGDGDGDGDGGHPNHRWLWPHTGEVFWQGILERERQERNSMKLERKRRNKERLARMRSRYKQKSLGRYVKPPPGAGYLPDTAA